MAALWDRPVFPILAFVSAIGSLGYFLYMRRTLRHLDPSAVVPARVQMALDVMAEGVVLIDEEEQIVLANASFVEQVGVPQTQLLGTRLHDIEWRHKNAPGIDLSLPWNAVLSESKQSTGAEMTLLRDEEERVFVVNASPILDGWDKAKGAIVTFDDITELARRTAELEHSNALLEKSQEEIQLQYQELEELSKRDPLTGVSNRRACLEVFEEKFESARGGDSLLSCVMVDVDYFKRINPTARRLPARRGSYDRLCVPLGWRGVHPALRRGRRDDLDDRDTLAQARRFSGLHPGTRDGELRGGDGRW
jgi:PAS domain S-box-containing protein